MVVLAIVPLVSVQLVVAVTAKGFVPLFCRVGGWHVGAPGGDVTTMLSACMTLAPVASVSCTVKSKVPTAVGVPEMTPAELKFIPGGIARLPDASDHEYDEAIPPLACSVVRV
jgi:hypothetical protein